MGCLLQELFDEADWYDILRLVAGHEGAVDKIIWHYDKIAILCVQGIVLLVRFKLLTVVVEINYGPRCGHSICLYVLRVLFGELVLVFFLLERGFCFMVAM